MARYIDADILKNKLRTLAREPEYQHEDENWKVGLCMAELAIHEIPTADVVQKSEVDKDIKVLTKEVAKQKAMLLDAIDTFRNLLCIDSYVDYEDTRKHYAVNIDDVNRIHAELKKKYVENTEEPT